MQPTKRRTGTTVAKTPITRHFWDKNSFALGFVALMGILLSFSLGVQLYAFLNPPVIGIAWRADTHSEGYKNTCLAIEEAGGEYVLLDQVISADLLYDDQGNLLEGVDETGIIDAKSAQLVKSNTYHGSNVESVLQDVDAVIFTGGEDISPSLFYSPQEWHGIEIDRAYNAERDVSDYLLMQYCLEEDIPVLGLCRGMQMLSVVSGANLIQDIPTYFDDHGIVYQYEHRVKNRRADGSREYESHSVQVREPSLLFDIYGVYELDGCPSLHHQAVDSVSGTRLKVTGSTNTNGVEVIEAVERTDKRFAVGVQFHPEAAVAKHVTNAENSSSYMSCDAGLSIFTRLMEEAADSRR